MASPYPGVYSYYYYRTFRHIEYNALGSGCGHHSIFARYDPLVWLNKVVLVFDRMQATSLPVSIRL